MYAPGQNLLNINQNLHMYGTKPIHIEQNLSFNHYTMGALDCKIPPQNYSIPHQFGEYYPQGGNSSLIHNFVSPLTEKHNLVNDYSKQIAHSQNQETNKHISSAIIQSIKDVSRSIAQFQERNKDFPSLTTQFKERCNDVPNSIPQFQERIENVPIANIQILERNKHVPILNQNEPLVVLKNKTIQFKKINGLFCCDLCEYSSQKVSSVKSHRMIHTGEKPFQCDLCSKSFRQKEHLKNHRMTHTKEKLFFCNECKYSCAVRSKMDQHNLIHKGIKPYVCTKCDYRCRTPFVMKNHIAKCGNAKTKCNMCNKTFTKAGALAIHKLKHSNDSKFSCNICAYTTKQYVRFKLHLSKEHPKDTIYVCRLCNFTCLKKLEFKIHRATHDDGRKWYKCDSCPYSSNDKISLKNHIIEFKNDTMHNSTSNKVIKYIIETKTASNGAMKYNTPFYKLEFLGHRNNFQFIFSL